MKIEYKLKPEPSVEYTRGKCYFVRYRDSVEVNAAYITGWTDTNAEVIYFKSQDTGYAVTYSSLQFLKEAYTVISEAKSITFGAE